MNLNFDALVDAWVAAHPGAHPPSRLGPVSVSQSRSYRVRRWVVMVPQEDRRYVGSVEHARFETQAEAQAAADVLLASNAYTLDDAGWWRRLA